MNEFVDKLSSNRIIPLAEGYKDADLESDFETCNDDKLWPALKKKYVGDAYRWKGG